MLLRDLARRLVQLQSFELETLALEAADDLAHHATLQKRWLERSRHRSAEPHGLEVSRRAEQSSALFCTP